MTEVQGLADQGLLPEAVFARLYEHLVAASARRALGTYFTPSSLVNFMFDLSEVELGRPPAFLGEPGAGVGAFAIEASRRWPGVPVAAVDVNPVTLGLLAAADEVAHSQRDDADTPSRIGLVCEDFLAWLPREWPAGQQPRLLVGNPPYSRHQGRSEADKAIAAAAAAELLPRRTGSLAAYMLAAGLRFLGPRDVLCLLLPDGWLEAAYGTGLRHWLVAHRERRVQVWSLPDDRTRFFDARVNAVVVCVGPAVARDQQLTVQEGRHAPDGVTVVRSGGAIVVDREGTGGDPLREAWRRVRREVSPTSWTPVTAPVDPTTPAATVTAQALNGAGLGVQLGDVVRLRRGVATGGNAVFLLDDAAATSLPRAVLAPALHRLRDVPGDVLDVAAFEALAGGRRRWLLDLRREHDSRDPSVDALLASEAGRRARVGELCRRRALTGDWALLELAVAPRVILGPATRGVFRVVLNDVGAHITNNLFGMTAQPGWLPNDDAWLALVTWLRSPEAQAEWHDVALGHHGGLWKLEPGPARRIVVPGRVATALRAPCHDSGAK